ncbi:response regulator transcription factor [Magnetospirillum sp. SS-4]|uniref:response regulator transcription factor n=1 Tax=Magnetospirillum sp. SS-4 TaxID=2681465 RepID=UPI00137D3193|nr:response regulator transcription factor [Magnetospirillum sp. SS-4]CAA7625071.1 putative transcriptional regulatory protein OmpR [Magnetospirillum sp. SS-4]
MATADQAFILVVEDDAQVRSLVCRIMAREDYDVSAVASAADARTAIKARSPDLILLDLGLPGGSGLDLSRWARSILPSVGIIIVTGKSDIGDRIIGLDSGADDYITKPFDTDELLARVRSLLRRLGSRAEAASPPRECLSVGEWGINPDLCALVHEKTVVKLTLMEFRLLTALAERPNRTATREWLLDRLKVDEDIGERMVDYHVHALRGKLRKCGIGDGVVASIRGVGYAFVPPPPE